MRSTGTGMYAVDHEASEHRRIWQLRPKFAYVGVAVVVQRPLIGVR